MKRILLVSLLLVLLVAATFSAAFARDWPSYYVCFKNQGGTEWEGIYRVGEQLISVDYTGPAYRHYEMTFLDRSDSSGWLEYNWTGGDFGDFSACDTPSASTLGDVFGSEPALLYAVYAGPYDHPFGS